jgi:hypothetical protein
MKKRTLLNLALLLLVAPAYSQNEYAKVYKKNKVKTIVDRSIMLGFESKQDSCDEAFTYLNEKGQTTKYIRDYKCQGWDLKFETTYEYDSLDRMLKIVNLSNDKMLSVVDMQYDENDEIIITTVQSFDPASWTMTSRRIYYNDSMQMDSVLTRVDGSDTMTYMSYYNYYQNGELQSEHVYTYPGRERLTIHDFKFGKLGKMTEYNVETFMPEYSYKKSGFDYDKLGRLSKSLDLDANTSLEFFPDETDLNRYTMHYNRFGTLEKTVLHYYTYYK